MSAVESPTRQAFTHWHGAMTSLVGSFWEPQEPRFSPSGSITGKILQASLTEGHQPLRARNLRLKKTTGIQHRQATPSQNLLLHKLSSMHPIIAVPVTLFLVVRSYRRKSLTPVGIVAAAVTATIHAVYPSSVPFALLVSFFMLGTTATKVKHDIKSTLTVSSTGAAGGEGARTSVQVLANSGFASLLILVHLMLYGRDSSGCFGGEDRSRDLLLVGIVANYAAVTADTLSSELGILSKSKPRLVTAPWRGPVPAGTNGGVTIVGLFAGMAGSLVIGVISTMLLSFCGGTGSSFLHTRRPEWDVQSKITLALATAAWGTAGSLLDSFMGAVLQASVVDRRTGKVVEGQGGGKVLTTVAKRSSATGHEKNATHEDSRMIFSGMDLLDNNGVNFLMATIMSLGGVFVGSQFL